jgi:hypothetical protein
MLGFSIHRKFVNLGKEKPAEILAGSNFFETLKAGLC